MIRENAISFKRAEKEGKKRKKKKRLKNWNERKQRRDWLN